MIICAILLGMLAVSQLLLLMKEKDTIKRVKNLEYQSVQMAELMTTQLAYNKLVNEAINFIHGEQDNSSRDNNLFLAPSHNTQPTRNLEGEEVKKEI